MATWFDVLLERKLLWHEVGLDVKDVLAATAGRFIGMLEASTFDREAFHRPKATLADYLFHAFELPQIFGMVIKWLSLPCQGIDAITHVWPLQLMCLVMLWILEDIRNTKTKKKKEKHALLTIFIVEMASSAHFRWLGTLSNRKRLRARPFALSSKMLIAWSTWAMSFLELKYLSWFLPDLNTMQASFCND